MEPERDEFEMAKKLPVSINDFETMRRDGYVYVDKTRLIHRMVTQGKFYFLSRPRRFGKSVLATTLKCLYQGRKELFDGLWIAEGERWEWREHPVITLDFTGISNSTPEALQQDLDTRLHRIAADYGVVVQAPSLASKFTELIQVLSQKFDAPAAILIDEYDKPIIDHLGRGEAEFAIAKANRDVLKRFFGVLKDITIAPMLRFVFLTGVTRFSKVSIFSELNNLDDISMNDAYAGLLGYTQEELARDFAPCLRRFADRLGWTVEQVLTKLAEQYNGYRFTDAELTVYNPCSILKALNVNKFEDFWFETGTPTFLINLLFQEQYALPEIELGIEVTRAAFTTFDIERLSPEALLFQTGYATIKAFEDGVYTLSYPNREVKNAFSESLLWELAKGAPKRISSSITRLAGYLEKKQFETFFETMTAIFAAIPYDIEAKRDEAYFHTLFYLMMTASGIDARSSVLTCRGRIDLALVGKNAIYIIEFKCGQSADTAIRQIRANGYADPYRAEGKAIWLIGIEFSPELRNVAGWKIEPLNG